LTRGLEPVVRDRFLLNVEFSMRHCCFKAVY
jgi:hypothetical protein